MPDWLLPQLLHHDAALLGGAVLINAGFTFIGALALALLAARSAGSPRVAKWLLLSPWLRVLWEIARGATPDAYVLSEHAGTQGGLGSFQLGVGLQAPLVPTLQAQLGMQGGEHRYAYSVGDGVSHWLYRHWGATPLLIALAGSLGVSCVLLFARVRLYRDWQRRLERPAALLGSVRAGLRRVQLFGCDEPQVGAFTSGVLRPRIWLPASLAAAVLRSMWRAARRPAPSARSHRPASAAPLLQDMDLAEGIRREDEVPSRAIAPAGRAECS